jgi:hypothetical protein
MGATCCDAKTLVNPNLDVYFKIDEERLSVKSVMGDSEQFENGMETKEAINVPVTIVEELPAVAPP